MWNKKSLLGLLKYCSAWKHDQKKYDVLVKFIFTDKISLFLQKKKKLNISSRISTEECTHFGSDPLKNDPNPSKK